MLGTNGIDLVKSMSSEMIQWIRDTTQLWIANKGAGSVTTESEALEGQDKYDQKLKGYYDSKVEALEREL